MKLRWRLPDGSSGEVSTTKRVVTIGSDPANVLCVNARGLAPHHAHLMVRKNGVQIGTLGGHDVRVDGQTRISEPLAMGSRITLGELEVTLLADSPSGDSSRAAAQRGDAAELNERLLWFTRRLGETREPGQLLETLLDLLITTLDAERGMIVVSPERPTIVAARGVDAPRAQQELGGLPDQLLSRVCQTGVPLVSLDVQGDRQLSASTTVARLGLRAVLALPLGVSGRVHGVLVLASSAPGPGFTDPALAEATLFAALASLLVTQAMRVADLEEEVLALTGTSLMAATPGIEKIYALARRAAPSDLSVLITGETGTGKEVLARAIHRSSATPDGPFVAINCGAIPEGLIESELFGHVRGAFSGAVTDRAGKVEMAAGGTLFLDEVGDTPLAVQVRLLRTLQQRTVVRVGDTRERPVQFRLISATHQDLARAVAAGTFRQDLYYRLRDLTLELPPLRDRGEDLVLLARHFLAQYARQYRKEVPVLAPESILALARHAWPGNVRELESRIRRAVVLAESTLITPAHLDLETPGSAKSPASPTLDEAIREFRGRYIASVLAAQGGSKKKAAQVLGIDPRTLYRFLTEAS